VVRVRPVNRHPPTFRRRRYVFTLPNVTVLAAGSVVGAVDAADADTGELGRVEYFLSGDSDLAAFQVPLLLLFYNPGSMCVGGVAQW